MDNLKKQINSLNSGDKVKLNLSNDDEQYEGIVSQVNSNHIKLINCIDLISKLKLEGESDFDVSEIKSICLITKAVKKPPQLIFDIKYPEQKPNDNLQCHVRKICWKSQSNAPSLKNIPSKFYIIESNENQEKYIPRLLNQKKLGVSLFNEKRSKEISLIYISTSTNIYCFNKKKLGNLDKRIKEIMEDKSILKVTFDFYINKKNLKDTCDIEMFNCIDIRDLYKKSNKINRIYKEYNDTLPFLVQSHLAIQYVVNGEKDYILENAKNVMYLLDLYQCVNKCYLQPSKYFLDSIRNEKEKEAQALAIETYHYPQGFFKKFGAQRRFRN